MLVQALLAGLVVGLSKMEYFFGYSMFNRPIVEGAIMGLVLGDPVTGTIIGATLEIVFLGSFPVGAAVSPDGGTAAGVSTAFAILTGVWRRRWALPLLCPWHFSVALPSCSASSSTTLLPRR